MNTIEALIVIAVFVAQGFAWGWVVRDERERRARAKAIAKRIVEIIPPEEQRSE